MRKNLLFYTPAIVLMASVLLFFNKGYRALSTYSDMQNHRNIVSGIFENLSHNIHDLNALRLLNVDSLDIKTRKLISEDSLSIIHNLDALKSAVIDSINTRLVSSLDIKIRNELPKLLNRINGIKKESDNLRHDTSYASINSIIRSGLDRTSLLIDRDKQQIHNEIRTLRRSMIVFIVIYCFLFLLIFADLAKQISKRRIKEKELETVFSRISDSVISVDNQWRYTFLNDAALATNPMGRKALLGKVIWDLYPQLRITPFWDKFHEAVRTQEVSEMEGYYKPMDIWMSVKLYPSANGLTVFYHDITKNVSDKTKLDQSLKEITDYKYALDESAIVAITDQKGIIRHANDNFCRISKYSHEELIGQDHRIINSGYHSKDFIRDLWTTIANGNIWKGELRNRAKDGTVYWVDTTIVPFLDEKNKPYQYIAIRSDITERKKLEEEQAIFSSIVNSSDDAIFSRKLDGTIMTWNKGAEKTYGYTEKEIIGKNNSLLIPSYRAYEEDQILEQILNEKPIEHYETERMTKEGKIIIVSITISPIRDLFGKVIGVSKISRDITYRKMMEEKISSQNEELTGILERITDGFMILDNNFRYVFVNREIGKMVSRDPASLIGKVMWDEFPEAVGSSTYNAFLKARETQQYVSNIDYYPPFDLWQENRIYPGPNHLSVFIRDISELKKAEQHIIDLNVGLEEKVIERTAQLEAVNKELEAFTYSVSHDLRAPLRAVNGYAKILEEDFHDKIDEEGQRLMAVIKSNATRMGLLIDELLEFSKLGRKPLNKTLIDSNKLVRSAIAEVNAGMNVKANIYVSSLHSMIGDQALMSHVLVNLISNAVKYSSHNEKPSIQIQTEKKDGEIVFCIKDNGVGFDMRYVDKLFGVFQRLHSQDEFPGTGVGLAIVQRIINKHGGNVWAKGAINKGAEFYFSIPDTDKN